VACCASVALEISVVEESREKPRSNELNFVMEITPFHFNASVQRYVQTPPRVSDEAGVSQGFVNCEEKPYFRLLFALNATSLRTRMRSFCNVSEGLFRG
jgi:hypothetical protein